MSKGQKIFFAILRTIFLFAGGFCFGRFLEGEYLLSAIGGIICSIGVLVYISYWEYLMLKLKDEYEIYKDIVKQKLKEELEG